MTHKVFGQHEDREERAIAYQAWSGASRVLPGQAPVIPKIPPAEAVLIEIRSLLKAHQVVMWRPESAELKSEVEALLTPEERPRVRVEAHDVIQLDPV